MLNIFHRKQHLVRIMLGVILFLVCVTMVITLIPGLTGDVGDSAANPVIAEVEGDRITVFEVQQSLQQVGMRSRIPPEMMPYYTNQILNEMILEKASVREANRLGLKVDEPELLTHLRKDPTLFPNGNFIGQQQYEDLITEKMGMNVAQFEQRFRESLLLDKLRMLVTDSLAVTPEEIHEAFVNENEKMALDYVWVVPVDFKKDVGNPSDSVLEEYFKNHKDQYQVPEKRSAKIMFVDRAKLGQVITIPDADLKKYYQDHVDTYRVPERVTVQHILFKADPKDGAKLKEAKTKAEDLLKKLKAGADFAAMAKQYSEDPGTAKAGGILSGITRKQTVPEFEKVAFSLQPGVLSDPVQTSYGIHIIKVISHEQAHLQTFDEVKAGIQKEFSDERIKTSLTDAAETATVALGHSPSDIATLAEKYHGELLTPAPFAKDDLLPTIGKSDAFMAEVFGLEKGHAGPAIQLGNGFAIPVLEDVFPPHAAALSEVKEQVKQDYILDQAKEKAIAKAKELAKVLEQQQDKKDLKKAAESLKLTIKSSPLVTRDGTIPSLGSVKDMDPKIFSTPVGGTGGPLTVAGGQLIYQVTSRELPKEEELAAKRGQIQERLLGQKRQLAFDVFQDNLKTKLIASGRLKIHQDALVQLSGAAGSAP